MVNCRALWIFSHPGFDCQPHQMAPGILRVVARKNAFKISIHISNFSLDVSGTSVEKIDFIRLKIKPAKFVFRASPFVDWRFRSTFRLNGSEWLTQRPSHRSFWEGLLKSQQHEAQDDALAINVEKWEQGPQENRRSKGMPWSIDLQQ